MMSVTVGHSSSPRYLRRTRMSLTPEEEAIAQDLLQLSKSLPPLGMGKIKAVAVAVLGGQGHGHGHGQPLTLTPPDTPDDGNHRSPDSEHNTLTTLTSLLPHPDDHHHHHHHLNVNVICHTNGHRHGGNGNATPLTPSASEYSSDTENVCPSPTEQIRENGGHCLVLVVCFSYKI
jgi:hypothetical protein